MPRDAKTRANAAELIRRFANGEQSAANDLYDQYAQRLIALARTRLSAKTARRVDPEDILQSVFRSFFVGLREERWLVDDLDDLWRLLAGITLNKLGEKVRFHRRLKRSAAREVQIDGNVHEQPDNACASREPSPADVVAAAEELAWLLARFSVEERVAIELRLQRHSIEEISQRTGRSARTICRWLEHARELMESRAAKFAQSRRFALPREAPLAEPDVLPATLDYRDYKIVRLIGSGGTCKVYAAEIRATGQTACIKVMRKQQRYQRQLVERFLFEAAIVSELTHPHIVAAHGVGRLPDGGYFMAVDLVDGPNLLEAVRSGRFSLPTLLAALAQIADALGYCHERGVVHCDVQPRNILLSHDGQARLTDFGFARRLNAGLPRDELDAFVAGTPGFMAPEQLEGAQISAATDVYGTGAVLYWLLTHNTPNDSIANRTQETLSFPADVTNELRELCERCLVLSAQERTISTGEISAALRSMV
jgi:tRNA A-37 threonylcarbamoyl transferase component Bud32/DNA-directed RNA polymerase specialized sigma24 family protein